MSNRAAVAVAAAAAAGAWWCLPVPMPVALLVVAAGLGARRPTLLIVAAALLTSSLGAQAWAGLEPPDVTRVGGWLTLLSDPDDVRGSVKVDVRVGRRRVEAWARGQAAAGLRDRLAGERVWMEGTLRPLDDRVQTWLARRHVAARLSVDRVGAWRPGLAPTRLANGLRRTLLAGVAHLPPDHRGLFAGFVLGDRRDQSDEVGDDFRGSGLTHLLAVSGQNVAFVVALAGPMLVRMGLRARWAATIALILLFALMTRWEPSVLRASAMAGLAVTARSLGRPVDSIRLLALAATGIVIADPLLIGHLAFVLSVAASAGIVVLSRPIAERVPGPRVLADAIAVTVAAQVGVAPVLVPVFGGLPVASVPANVLAAPAAGPVMMWGMSAGIVAGLLGGSAATVLHLPTHLLVGWIGGVARWGAALPVGLIRPGQLVALAGLAGSIAAARRSPWPRAPRLAAVACAVALLAGLAPRPGASAGVALVHGAELWRSGSTVVVVIDDPDPGRLLDALRVRGVRRIDLLVATRGTRSVGGSVRTLRRRVAVQDVVAPPGHRIRDARALPAGAQVRAGRVEITALADAPRLEVVVRLLDPAAAGR